MIFYTLKNLFSGKNTSQKSKLIFDKRSICAQQALKGLSFSLVNYAEDADLIWTIFADEDLYNSLRPYQLINHIPNEQALSDKGNLLNHLKQFAKTKSLEQEIKKFIPESYQLYLPSECQEFLLNLPRENHAQEPWILKPTDLSRGRGMVIFNDYHEIREFCKNPDQNLYDYQSKSNRKYVIQKYIKNVLLLNKRKSETRVYWLIASLDPLLVLMYKEGTVRLNTLEFELDNFDNQLIHITNVYQQKNHAQYDPFLVLKWSFENLDKYIAANFAVYSYIEKRFLPQVRECLELVIRATKDQLLQKHTQGLTFGLYGADFIIDQDLKPWLTEIQFGPGLSLKDKVKKKIIPAMMKDAFKIMLEIQKRKREKRSLADFNNIGNFLWVIGPT